MRGLRGLKQDQANLTAERRLGRRAKSASRLAQKSDSPAGESDPLACFPGNTNQLVGHCNKVGSNWNQLPQNMIGNIPGRSVSAVKESKQPPVGQDDRPGCRRPQALPVGPITPGIFPPNCLQQRQVTTLPGWAPRPVSRGPLPASGRPAQDPQHEPQLFAFFFLLRFLADGISSPHKTAWTGNKAFSSQSLRPSPSPSNGFVQGLSFLLVFCFFFLGPAAAVPIAVTTRGSFSVPPDALV